MTSKAMLDWQYKQILAELAQVQLHASDPSCPCALADIGEYCLAKHTLMLTSLAGETSAMDDANSELWDDLQESATEMHHKTKEAMCKKSPYPDLITWSREWRKKIEPIYYACNVKSSKMKQETICTLAQHTDYPSQQEIEKFIDSDPLGNEKAKYCYKDQVRKHEIIDATHEFLRKFSRHTRINPLIGKFGHKIYFSPDKRAIERLGLERSWIEYGLHSVTRRDPMLNCHEIHRSKITNLGNIEIIIHDADGMFQLPDRLYYYKSIHEGRKPYSTIVLEAKKIGEQFAVTDDFVRYITQLPEQTRKNIEENKKGKAPTANLTAEGVSSGESVRTTSEMRKSSLTLGHHHVKCHLHQEPKVKISGTCSASVCEVKVKAVKKGQTGGQSELFSPILDAISCHIGGAGPCMIAGHGPTVCCGKGK